MKYLSSLLISIFFYSLTYSSSSNEFLSKDIIITIILLLIVFAIEVRIASLFAKNLFLHNLILAIFTSINILYLNLILIEEFIGLSIYKQLLALLVAIFILTTFMNMLDEFKRLARMAPGLIALAIAAILIKTHLTYAFVPNVVTNPGMTSAQNIRLVDFETKPNVYFISFDSIIPIVLLKKYLGLETTTYHEVLDTHFRRFNNFFSDQHNTVASLSSFLAFDMSHYYKAKKSETSKHFYSGLIPSPLLEIFKHNGYETSTLYINYFFGTEKGPYVDNYLVNKASLKDGVCRFTPKNELYAFTYMGYCALLEIKIFRKLIRILRLDSQSKLSQFEYLIKNLKEGLQKDAPQVFLGYVYSPGHTPQNYDHSQEGSLETYQQFYLNGSKDTTGYLNELLSFIDQEDPNAIVYLFGDHGPWMSRRSEFASESTFYVQDKFGVYGGIYPPDRCASTFDSHANLDFMTVSQGARLIIKCLSGGEDAFIVQNDYILPDAIGEGENRYESYLYE